MALGGFTSRGLGWVRLEEPEVLLVEGAEEMLKMLAGAEAGEVVRDDEAKSWMSAFRERLNRMNGKGARDA